MKIAVTGKGGVGKTTLSAFLCKFFARKGSEVFAIDADPDSNLAMTLGFEKPDQITPLIEMKKLIKERTGAEPGKSSPFFKLNPTVEDIPDKYFVKNGNIRLAVMGSIRGGGTGCACPENAFLKALLTHLILYRNEVVILDMEAGIEHLGRGTATGVDQLIIVVEPGRRSIETALRIKKPAEKIGIHNFSVVGNKIRNDEDRKFLEKELSGFNFLGFLPFDDKIIKADMNGGNLLSVGTGFSTEVEKIVDRIKED